jgi:hypothetical protein
VVGFLVMGNNQPSTETAIVKIPDAKKDPAIVTTQPVKPPVKKDDAPAKDIAMEPKKEEAPPKKDESIPKKDEGIMPGRLPVKDVNVDKVTPGDVGYFKPSFDQQVRRSPISKNETVTAGIFKTSSGWEDAKYYLLMDGVQPGTIIKVVNPGNNKMVYAKVLGEMSGIRQNEGLNIRISNAAASALQITEQDKFVVKVNY